MRGSRYPPAPTKNSSIFVILEFLFYRDFAKCSKGGFEQHRPAVQSGWQKSPSGAFLDAWLAISTRAHQENVCVEKYTDVFCRLLIEQHKAPAG